MTYTTSAPGITTWPYEPHATSRKFEGRDIGGPISGFVVDAVAGRGPGAHIHPYPETFVVLQGAAVFTVDGRPFRAGAGHVLAVPAHTTHGFIAAEPGVRLLGIHASPEIVQTFL
jgi:quercetin dioxygenase-like cupin family protein